VVAERGKIAVTLYWAETVLRTWPAVAGRALSIIDSYRDGTGLGRC
jgi:hypothetical protein